MTGRLLRIEGCALANALELKLARRLTPSRRNLLWGLSLLLIGTGYILRPRAVEVEVHPRRDPGAPYWRGSIPEPAVDDGSVFLQLLINSYRSPPLPFPERIPPYRVRFSMNVRVRTPGVHRFELDSAWNGALDVDGRRVFGSGPRAPHSGREGEVELAAGTHTVTLSVQPAEQPSGIVRLLWKEPDGNLRPLVARDVTAPESPLLYAVSVRLATPFFWSGVALFSSVTLLWLVGIQEESKRDIVLASAVIALFAFAARGAHFDTYPRTNGDELHNAWAGFNLIHEGTPRSWTWLPFYTHKTPVMWFSYEYPVAEATFDHPPLLPVLTGLEATLLGAETMFDCRLPVIRPLMVVVGTLSVVILFLVACELVGLKTAFLAAVLMACSPLVVFNSRLVKEDCLVQLFALLALYAYSRSRRDSGSKFQWLTGAFSGLAALSKAMGISIGFALAAVAFAERERRPAAAARILGLSLLVASLYPLYGYAIDGETYRRVMAYLSSAYPQESFVEKFLILPRLILEPKISAVTPLIDGWILLGWLAVARLFRHRAVSITFIAYLLILMATLYSRSLWGFYIVPLLPFLCLAAAIQIQRAFVRQDSLSVFLVAGLGFLPQFAALPHAPDVVTFRALLILAALPLVPVVLRLPWEHPGRTASRWLLAAMLVAGVLANFHRCLTTF